MPDLPLIQKLRSVAGSDLHVEFGEGGMPLVAPESDACAALMLQTASAEGWAVQIAGGRTWLRTDPHTANADFALSPDNLSAVTYLNAGDLVVTVQAGMPWSRLRDSLADVGAWLPIDPPGDNRTVGSVVATATAGPLRAGFGGVRDHVLGATLVTGDGKIVKPGGQVVKNVAGFELARLASGSFGAFGFITQVTFRLRAIPRSDITLTAHGNRDQLLSAGLRLLERGINPAAMELFASDPDEAWTLASRLIGTDEAVTTARDAVAGATDTVLHVLEDPVALWRDHSLASLDHPTTLRLGAPPLGLSTALDLIRHDFVDGWTSVTVFPGAIRWSGTADTERIKLFRHQAAQHEFPVTVERAPHGLLRDVGHFGAYREGVGRLVDSLRVAFDPARVFSAPVNAA